VYLYHMQRYSNPDVSYYLDTSIYGGYFDPEFMRHSRMLFNHLILKSIVISKSFITEIEIKAAPKIVKDLYSSIPDHLTKVIEYSDRIDQLAQAYVDHNIASKSQFADCLHVAAASVNGDYALISWDYKHILREDRIRGFNYVNRSCGLSQIYFLSPSEVLRYEN